MLPLHWAAWGSSSVAVVQVLHAAYPEAAKNKNDKGETPADLAATNNGNAEVKAFFASGQDVRQPRYKPPPYKPPPLRKQRSTSFPKGAHLQSPASDAHTDLDRLKGDPAKQKYDEAPIVTRQRSNSFPIERSSSWSDC